MTTPRYDSSGKSQLASLVSHRQRGLQKGQRQVLRFLHGCSALRNHSLNLNEAAGPTYSRAVGRKPVAKKRHLHLESLEDRRLFAVGPSLVSVVPNSGVFLENNVLQVPRARSRFCSPREAPSIRPRWPPAFRSAQRHGGGAFGASAPRQMCRSRPGFIGLGDTGCEVVMRFAKSAGRLVSSHARRPAALRQHDRSATERHQRDSVYRQRRGCQSGRSPSGLTWGEIEAVVPQRSRAAV